MWSFQCERVIHLQVLVPVPLASYMESRVERWEIRIDQRRCVNCVLSVMLRPLDNSSSTSARCLTPRSLIFQKLNVHWATFGDVVRGPATDVVGFAVIGPCKISAAMG